MKNYKTYSAPVCDIAVIEATSMLAASYGDEGVPGSYNPDFDNFVPKPF